VPSACACRAPRERMDTPIPNHVVRFPRVARWTGKCRAEKTRGGRPGASVASSSLPQPHTGDTQPEGRAHPPQRSETKLKQYRYQTPGLHRHPPRVHSGRHSSAGNLAGVAGLGEKRTGAAGLRRAAPARCHLALGEVVCGVASTKVASSRKLTVVLRTRTLPLRASRTVTGPKTFSFALVLPSFDFVAP
jgi:hypothetical protein